ncbi:hypothetical protein ACHAQH_008066 [Verticillium albo-atrum]
MVAHITNERPTIPLEVTITDVTGDEDKYTLDSHGFQYLKHESREKEFTDLAALKGTYYAEMEQLYKDVTGANRVHIFGHQVRRGPSNWHSLGEGNAAKKGPLHRVHVDQSTDGAGLILRKHIPAAEVDDLLQRRYQIVNIWRPITTVYKDPLAVAEAYSVDDKDLVAAQVLYQDGSRNETWAVLPSDQHRWYFKYGLRPDEVLLIKCFDSKAANGLARRAPHCAFEDPGEVEREDRQSVEVRALLFF